MISCFTLRHLITAQSFIFALLFLSLQRAWLQPWRNSWEISSPHTLFSLSLSLSRFFLFFSFLEAKYEMPDALATNLTQLKSKAHKNHCKLPHNTQSCHLGLKSKDFRKLHRCPQWRSTGSAISRYCPAKCSCFSHADLDGLLFPF